GRTVTPNPSPGGRGESGSAAAVADDLVDLLWRIAKASQGGRHGLIDDLEVAAAGELLEFDKREVRLDAGRVAVHGQRDGPGRGDASHLGIASAVFLTEREHAIRLMARGLEQVVGAVAFIQSHRWDRQTFILLRRHIVSSPAMIADDAQHRLAIGRKTRER